MQMQVGSYVDHMEKKASPKLLSVSESHLTCDLQLKDQLASTHESDTTSSNQDNDDLSNDEDVGVKVLRSKVRMLRTRLSQVHTLKEESVHAVQVLEIKLKQVLAENKRLERKLTHMSATSDSYLSLTEKCKNLETDNEYLRKEVEQSRMLLKEAELNHSKREEKLSTALKQVDRLKERMADDHTCKTQSDTLTKKERDDMLATISTLEKQKRELVTVVSKQMKLVDIMKRMTIHVEASRLLSLTEDEFKKTFQWETTSL